MLCWRANHLVMSGASRHLTALTWSWLLWAAALSGADSWWRGISEHPRSSHCQYLSDLERTWPALCSPVLPARSAFMNDLVILFIFWRHSCQTLQHKSIHVARSTTRPAKLASTLRQSITFEFYALASNYNRITWIRTFGVCSECARSACTVAMNTWAWPPPTQSMSAEMARWGLRLRCVLLTSGLRRSSLS